MCVGFTRYPDLFERVDSDFGDIQSLQATRHVEEGGRRQTKDEI